MKENKTKNNDSNNNNKARTENCFNLTENIVLQIVVESYVYFGAIIIMVDDVFVLSIVESYCWWLGLCI